MFSRKKPEKPASSSRPVLRGRDRVDAGAAAAGSDNNPLARRFHADDEPDTVDLQDSGRHYAEMPETAEPETQSFETGAAGTPFADPAAHRASGLIELDPETGKFYLLPALGDEPARLGDEPVRAPTELRSGDRIRIGVAEFRFSIGKGEESS